MIGQLRIQFHSDLQEVLKPKQHLQAPTLREISHLTGISFRTLRRYQARETKPTLKNITRFYKAYKNLWQDEKPSSQPVLASWDDKETILRFMIRLIKSKSEVTLDTVSKEFGTTGITLLESLKNLGFITVNGNSIQINQKSLPYIIRSLIALRPSEFDLNLTNCFLIRINQQGKERISHLLEKFNQEFSTILRSSIYKGDECYFFTHLAGKF